MIRPHFWSYSRLTHWVRLPFETRFVRRMEPRAPRVGAVTDQITHENTGRATNRRSVSVPEIGGRVENQSFDCAKSIARARVKPTATQRMPTTVIVMPAENAAMWYSITMECEPAGTTTPRNA